MTCRDFADFLADYIEDALPAAIRRQFEAHLAECPDCVAYLQQYRDTIHLAACAGADDWPPVPEEVVRVIVLARQS